MRTLDLESEPLAVDVSFSDDAFRVVLEDGRELSIPLVWFPVSCMAPRNSADSGS